MAGTILGADKMVLRLAFGEALSKRTGSCYEVSVNPATGEPIVRSQETGKWFVLDWAEIVEMAVAAGIDRGDQDLN